MYGARGFSRAKENQTAFIGFNGFSDINALKGLIH